MSPLAPRPVRVPSGSVAVEGELTLPEGAPGLVAFAHGSGSSRHSPRNRMVAEVLQGAGLGTLLLDLLTPAEDARDRVTREHRFDIGLLARRVIDAVDWCDERAPGLPLGLFGASTGAAAALVAAARRPGRVGAVVSRGGRPDLAADALAAVRAPTLLIVGAADPQVVALNRAALAAMRAPAELRLVSGATHLFEEPGALEEVAALARDWFRAHLVGPGE